MLKIKEDVLFQKDYRISDDEPIYEYALSHSSEIDASAPIAVISVGNSYLELNLAGALIFESVENTEELPVMCGKFVKLFGLSKEKAEISISSFCQTLKDKGIVEEIYS